MSIDLKFVELTADVLGIFSIKYVYTRVYTYVFFSTKQYDPSILKKLNHIYYKYQQRSLQNNKPPTMHMIEK